MMPDDGIHHILQNLQSDFHTRPNLTMPSRHRISNVESVVALSATPNIYAPPAMTYVMPRDFTEPRVAEQPFRPQFHTRRERPEMWPLSFSSNSGGSNRIAHDGKTFRHIVRLRLMEAGNILTAAELLLGLCDDLLDHPVVKYCCLSIT